MSAGEVARGLAGKVAHGLRRAVGGDESTSYDEEPRSRWRSVTVNRSEDEVAPGGQLPAALAALGDSVEVRVRPAPGGKGTELSARLRSTPDGPRLAVAPQDGEDPRERVRSALRQAKQLVEVGEVLRVDPAPHGHRPDTPGGRLVETATRHAGGEGVL